MVAREQFEDRLARLESKLKVQRWAMAAVLAVAALSFSFSAQGGGEPARSGILQVKGLIIEDAEGRPRIALGAPLGDIAGRNRRDPLIGMVYLDPNGNDRLTFGQLPDPKTPAGIKPRRTGGVGLLIHDREGIERGGYSVLDDETALLTLDWPKTGEAVALSASPRMAGLGMFYRSELGRYRDALGSFVFADKDSTLLKITDSGGRERLIVRSTETDQPQLMRFDETGNELATGQ